MPKQYGTPGPRMIYPDACTSRSLGACDPMAQLLFDRLLVQCDDQGRIEADAAVVRALCMPLIARATVKAVERWLSELAAEKMILQYVADDKPLIQVVNWWDFQGGLRRSYPSRWPAPKGWEGDRVRGLPTDAPERPPEGASAQPPRAVAEPSRAESQPNPAEPPLPNEGDAATIAARIMPGGGRWLSDREWVDAWDDLDRRFGSWVGAEIQPTYSELSRLGRVKGWDLVKRVELRLAERVRADDLAKEKARQEADRQQAEAEQRRIDEATPEERKRAALYRKAIGLAVKAGLTVPTDPAELQAFVDKHSPKQGAAA